VVQKSAGIITNRQPRPGVRFEQAGILHGDGTFEPLGAPMNHSNLRPDGMSIGVGIKVASAASPGWPTARNAAWMLLGAHGKGRLT
jgi:hypothetical protein